MNELSILDYLLIAFSIAVSWRVYTNVHPPAAEADPLAPQPAPSSGASPAVHTPGPDGDTPLAVILKRIATACRYDSIDTFLDGARRAYEMIVGAFAAGNMDPCADLLSPALRESFANTLAERAARGETAETMFIGFRSVTIENAGRDQGHAWIDVRFVAELVSVTRDREGRVISGSPDRVAVTSEVWTFERDLKAGLPGWVLVATDDDA